MEIFLMISLALLLVVNGFLVWRIMQPKEATKDDGGMNLLLQHINDLSRTVDQKIGESTKEMNMSVRNQFSESARLIKEITEELVRVGEGQKQVVGFADQLKDLQDDIEKSETAGILGEYYLETLLKNVLPPGSYQMQYAFTDGTIVDAAVFVRDKVIPIDSKFSLENYNRLVSERDPAEKERLEKLFVGDLKLRIVETSKYIKPSEGTMDFAFMFIPHEAIYYDLLVNTIGAIKDDTENLIQRAANRYKVIIVSPTSFLAYLQTVLQGLKALQIEDKAKDIVKRIEELGRHLKTYEEYHGKLGNSLSTTVNHFNSTSKEFKKIDKDVLRITGEAINIDILTLEKPIIEE